VPRTLHMRRLATQSTSHWTVLRSCFIPPYEDLHRHAARTQPGRCLLFGRITTEMMELACARRRGTSGLDDLSARQSAAKKYVVSSTMITSNGTRT